MYYISAGDVEKAKWAEEELRQYHRISKQSFRLDLDVPPPTLQASQNIPEANQLFMTAMLYKDKGFGNDYIDNQRRAEILFQKLLTEYPQSNKIDEAAYQLGDIYESKAYKQYRRAAAYYERCFQWNPKNSSDARMRAARIYDKQLSDRVRAIEIYREVTTHETDSKRIGEATKRLSDLSGTR
jgi:tetratricopeptide (TPR) repeat protein